MYCCTPRRCFLPAIFAIFFLSSFGEKRHSRQRARFACSFSLYLYRVSLRSRTIQRFLSLLFRARSETNEDIDDPRQKHPASNLFTSKLLSWWKRGEAQGHSTRTPFFLSTVPTHESIARPRSFMAKLCRLSKYHFRKYIGRQKEAHDSAPSCRQGTSQDR